MFLSCDYFDFLSVWYFIFLAVHSFPVVLACCFILLFMLEELIIDLCACVYRLCLLGQGLGNHFRFCPNLLHVFLSDFIIFYCLSKNLHDDRIPIVGPCKKAG